MAKKYDRRATGFIADTREELDAADRQAATNCIRFISRSSRPHVVFGGVATGSKASLSSPLVAIRDQEDVGSCTAQAYTRAAELYKLAHYGSTGPVLSPAQLYATSRMTRIRAYSAADTLAEIDELEDTGVNPIHVTRAASTIGMVAESQYPYKTASASASDVARRVPGFDIASMASVARVLGDFRMDVDDGCCSEIRAALSNGLPVLCAFAVREEYDQFWETAKDAVLDAQAGPTNYGGHANVITAYDGDLFLLDNSWGEQWGYGGSAWVTEAFVKQCSYLSTLVASPI